MTAAQAICLAVYRGLRFDLEGTEVVLLGEEEVIDELLGLLRPHKDAIKSLLEEYSLAPTPTDAVVAAAKLLRFGLSPPTLPENCAFHCGSPDETCRRCGATFMAHHALESLESS
jgi:hypothetical protein